MQPATMDAALLQHLMSAAATAPSVHGDRHWRFQLDPDTATLEVRAGDTREAGRPQPGSRTLHLSAGAALFNLRLAVEQLGREADVRLLPEPGEPDLLATLRVVRPKRTAAPHDQTLYDALWRRHDSRFAFSARALPPAVLAELSEAAHQEGATLVLPPQPEALRLVRLTIEAEHRGRKDAPALPAPRPLGPLEVAEEPAAPPTVGLLATPYDRQADWLTAGEALERVLLTATADSVRSSLLPQALEWEDLRRRLTVADEPRAYPQMLVRLGDGPAGTPAGPA